MFLNCQEIHPNTVKLNKREEKLLTLKQFALRWESPFDQEQKHFQKTAANDISSSNIKFLERFIFTSCCTNSKILILYRKKFSCFKVKIWEETALSRFEQDLLDDAETCRRKMLAASTLIGGLGGEKERWTEQSKEFEAQIGR